MNNTLVLMNYEPINSYQIKLFEQKLPHHVIPGKENHMIEDGGYSKPVNRASTPFPEKGSWEEKSLYALRLIGKGSAADIAGKIAELEETENVAALEEHVEKALSGLCHNKQLDCSLDEQVMIYSAE